MARPFTSDEHVFETGVDPRSSPLANLPDAVLEAILHMLRSDTKASVAMRATCKWIRKAFDATNACLVLGGVYGSQHRTQQPDLSAQLLHLLRHTRRLRTLILQSWLEKPSLAEVLQAAQPGQILHLDLSGDFNVMAARRPLHSLEPLAACTALQHLDLAFSNISDLRPLAACTALRHLDLTCCYVADIAPLAGCTALQYLDLRYNLAADITPLATCTALQYLSLNKCPHIADLSALAACTAMQHLDLTATSVSDLKPLAACTGLCFLGLTFTKVSDLTPLAACKSLMVER